ncbi:HGL319Cp [Eremothecium sinecaudum]|uniref:DASH complex subunit DAD1 n=1 Tax=Eremothecium sinecaudum TaxID=45286 RepID=A0A109UXY3_9SACH|nr:HGL319Cp [Eremothecium sinecaudum]AMD22021.1 HGL319Cp [Eremothecium sinecaudum]
MQKERANLNFVRMPKDAPGTDVSASDKYFVEQRELLIREINETMDSILNNLNGLNISLENSIAVGKEMESVSELWKVFYDGLVTGSAPNGTDALNSSLQDIDVNTTQEAVEEGIDNGEKQST